MSLRRRPRSRRNRRTRSPKGVMLGSCAPPAAKPDIECPGSAVLGRGFVKSKHKRPHVRQAQPVGNHPPQHPALLEERIARSRAALAGDHENHRMPGILRAAEKSEEHVM